MPRQSLDSRHIRKLGKTGNPKSPSYFLTLPVELIRLLEWSDGQKVTVKKSRNRIIVEKWPS